MEVIFILYYFYISDFFVVTLQTLLFIFSTFKAICHYHVLSLVTVCNQSALQALFLFSQSVIMKLMMHQK